MLCQMEEKSRHIEKASYLRKHIDNIALDVAKRGKSGVIGRELSVWVWNQG